MPGNRYKDSQIRRGIRESYNTRLFMKPPERDSDVFIITTEGDRLDVLASNFYGDSSMWWFIANANGLNSMTVEPGTSLRIPSQIN